MISNLREVNVNQDIQPDVQDEVKKVSPSKVNTKTVSEKDKSSVKKTLIYRVIGAKIAYYRTLRQLSQRELANKVNLSTSTLGRIERGKYNNGVPISTLLDIAEGLRIELSALVTFSEEEKKVWWEIDKNML
jgi:DNA-binding XRE family transcriptional regulator